MWEHYRGPFPVQVAHYFDAEPLLACVTMGMVVVNRRWARGVRVHGGGGR